MALIRRHHSARIQALLNQSRAGSTILVKHGWALLLACAWCLTAATSSQKIFKQTFVLAFSEVLDIMRQRL